jgi:hypothetical protein
MLLYRRLNEDRATHIVRPTIQRQAKHRIVSSTQSEKQPPAVLNQGATVGLLRSVAVALRKAKEDGAASHFEQLAAEIESSIADEHRTARLEKYRSELASWEAEVKYSLDWKLESFRTTMAFAQGAIKSGMLVNGAAAVALLAYLGNIKAQGDATSPFVAALGFFSSGVVAAALTFACSYLSQLFYTPGDKDATAKRWHYSALSLLLLSFAFFSGGAVSSYFAFSQATSVVQSQGARPDERRNAPGPKSPGPPPTYQPQTPTPQPNQKPLTQPNTK